MPDVATPWGVVHQVKAWHSWEANRMTTFHHFRVHTGSLGPAAVQLLPDFEMHYPNLHEFDSLRSSCMLRCAGASLLKSSITILPMATE